MMLLFLLFSMSVTGCCSQCFLKSNTIFFINYPLCGKGEQVVCHLSRVNTHIVSRGVTFLATTSHSVCVTCKNRMDCRCMHMGMRVNMQTHTSEVVHCGKIMTDCHKLVIISHTFTFSYDSAMCLFLWQLLCCVVASLRVWNEDQV